MERLVKMQNMVRIVSGEHGYLKRALKIQILKRGAPTSILSLIFGYRYG